MSKSLRIAAARSPGSIEDMWDGKSACWIREVKPCSFDSYVTMPVETVLLFLA